MGIIKGWKKNMETSICVFWAHEDGRTWAEVMLLEPVPALPKAEWTFITNVRGKFYFDHLKCQKFKTKAAAVKVAIAWMRKHPKGNKR